MILFHGSHSEVTLPDLSRSREDIDFGAGFYLTRDERMAKKWASSKRTAIVNRYELDLTGLKVFTFSLDKVWLDFIKSNRGLEENHLYDEYDVLIGPTADDKLYDTLQHYLNGILTASETIKILNVMGYSDQVVLKHDKALESLHFLGSKQLQSLELQQCREVIRTERRIASEKTLELMKQFAKERERREQNGHDELEI